jgi:hypothetical protein
LRQPRQSPPGGDLLGVGELRGSPLGCVAGTVTVGPIIVAPRLHTGRERQRLTCLSVPSKHLQAAAQAEQRVVVRGSVLDDRLELRCGLVVMLYLEQRTPERLAN